MNVLVFSVIIITIILLSTEYIQPILSGYKWSKILTAIITLALLAPFLWALAFRRTQREAYANVWTKTSQRGPLVLLLLSRVLLAVFFIAVLFDRLFSTKIALEGALISCFILALFSGKIKSFYGQIELRFLSNLNEREEEQPNIQEPLGPWDTHFTKFELNVESPYIGKTLLESRIREQFGVNIAMIERGNITINIPGRTERLYPNDILSVIGTDEQLKKFKNYLESTLSKPEYIRSKRSVSLQHFEIGRHSTLLGKSIRRSGIRELTQGLVVGIERNQERIINPESDIVFEINDKIWIVGNEQRIKVLSKEVFTK